MEWLNRLGWRLRATPPVVVDASLAVGIFALTEFQARSPVVAEVYRPPDALSVALVLLAVTPLLWRRHQPELALAVALSSWTPLGLLGYHSTGNFLLLSFLIPLYTVALGRGLGRSLVALAATLVSMFAVIMLDVVPPESSVGLSIWVITLAIPVAAWGGGRFHRRLRESVREQELLARRLKEEQAVSQRRAVLEERNRIARELHDVVAHHLGTIAMQANAARTTLTSRPEHTDQNLAFIHTSSHEALTEMRRLIGILKGTDADDLRAPRPTLADLDKLVARANEADLDTELEIRGTSQPLPAMLELSAYRIVQEALTNAIKHASPATARVLIHYRADQLHLTVTSTDGSPPEPPPVPLESSGLGLLGMRERVALFGGTLDAGPTPGGGFRVSATLPISGDAA